MSFSLSKSGGLGQLTKLYIKQESSSLGQLTKLFIKNKRKTHAFTVKRYLNASTTFASP